MRQFVIANSSEGVQFLDESSVQELFKLVQTFRPTIGYEYAKGLGTLRFHGQGYHELSLKRTDWVIVLRGDLVVMPNALVQRLGG